MATSRICVLPFAAFAFVIAAAIFAAPAFAALPPIDKGIAVSDWHVLGPFETGSRESGTDPTWADDGSHLDVSKAPPDFGKTYPSIFAAGGQAGWTTAAADADGKLTINIDLPDKGWEMRQDEWGMAGVQWRGYAYTEVFAPYACRAVVDAGGVGGFEINGRGYQGDPYGHGRWKQPVALDEGENRILVGLAGYAGQDEITFKIVPPPETPCGVIENDVLLPDLVNYTVLDYYAAGIPVVNYTDEWVENLEISLGPVEGLEGFNTLFDISIPPFGMVKVPMQSRLLNMDLGHRWKGSELEVPLTIGGDGWKAEYKVKFNVKNPDKSFRTTYIACVDNSAQKLSVLPPSNFDPNKKYALIYSTHGASVDSDGLAGAYLQKDWAYVAATTNRREFGFDWQDWGRLDAMESLAWAFRNFNIDPDRVILTGHSMGGHGCWHIGCTQPDLFAAMLPSAGWASFELYTPFTLRESEIFGDPQARKILDMCFASDRTELILPNLMDIPVMAVHGGADDDVPVTHARLLVGELQKMGYDARLWEVPGQPHWWDNTPDRPGIDCIDAPEMTDFMKDKVRNWWPREVRFVTYDLANTYTRYWVRVLAQDQVNDRSEVFAANWGITSNSDQIEAMTQNVSAISFETCRQENGVQMYVKVDGQGFVGMSTKLTRPHEWCTSMTVDCPLDNKFIKGGEYYGITLYKVDGKWSADAPDPPLPAKFAGVTGPIKRAFYRPFIIVDLSNGKSPRTLEICRNMAIRWWYRGNGYAPVKSWNELSGPDWKRNLILVGTWNSMPEGIMAEAPFSYREEGVEMGDRFIPGDRLAVEMVRPSPFDKAGTILICTASDEDSLRVCSALTPLYSGSSLPDFVVADRVGLARHGLAGAKALGFFDGNWDYDESGTYFSADAEEVP